MVSLASAGVISDNALGGNPLPFLVLAWPLAEGVHWAWQVVGRGTGLKKPLVRLRPLILILLLGLLVVAREPVLDALGAGIDAVNTSEQEKADDAVGSILGISAAFVRENCTVEQDDASGPGPPSFTYGCQGASGLPRQVSGLQVLYWPRDHYGGSELKYATTEGIAGLCPRHKRHDSQSENGAGYAVCAGARAGWVLVYDPYRYFAIFEGKGATRYARQILSGTGS